MGTTKPKTGKITQEATNRNPPKKNWTMKYFHQYWTTVSPGSDRIYRTNIQNRYPTNENSQEKQQKQQNQKKKNKRDHSIPTTNSVQ